jgi:hypothetical protein
MSSLKRHFTAVVGSKEHGLYISASLSSAARKIVSKLCASSKSKKVEFCVREITNGSKKKTYGPYLGEMKKLAKPIELKGRVIRYTPEVHLKKKKTAIKTGKKIGKKMRGGNIDVDGELTANDFFKYYVQTGDPPNNRIARQNPVKLKRRYSQDLINIRKNEPYIFFGEMKFLYSGQCMKLNGSGYQQCFVDQYAYQFVAYNEYKGLTKTAKFSELIYFPDTAHAYNIFSFYPKFSISYCSISGIPIKALTQLKDFLYNKRDPKSSIFEKTTFCNTIYDAVEDKLIDIVSNPQPVNQSQSGLSQFGTLYTHRPTE